MYDWDPSPKGQFAPVTIVLTFPRSKAALMSNLAPLCQTVWPPTKDKQIHQQLFTFKTIAPSSRGPQNPKSSKRLQDRRYKLWTRHWHPSNLCNCCDPGLEPINTKKQWTTFFPPYLTCSSVLLHSTVLSFALSHLRREERREERPHSHKRELPERSCGKIKHFCNLCVPKAYTKWKMETGNAWARFSWSLNLWEMWFFYIKSWTNYLEG